MAPVAEGRREKGRAVLSGVPGMIGERARVVKKIEGTLEPGAVRARGEEWLAVALDPAETIPAGSTVVVAAIERGLLVVYTIESP